MMKRFLWILSALLAVLAVYGSQEELNEKFFYLEEKPTEADGEVFLRGECKRNNYTPQKIRPMPYAEMQKLIELEKAGEGKAKMILAYAKTPNADHMLFVPVQTHETTSPGSSVGYRYSNGQFNCRAFELSNPNSNGEKVYAFKYAIDDEVMPVIEVTFNGEKYLPIVHLNDLQVYLIYGGDASSILKESTIIVEPRVIQGKPVQNPSEQKGTHK